MENQLFNQLVELAKENHDPASPYEIEIDAPGYFENEPTRFCVKYYCKPDYKYNYFVWVRIDYNDEGNNKFSVGVASERYGSGSADYIEEIDTIDEVFEKADELVYMWQPEDILDEEELEDYRA